MSHKIVQFSKKDDKRFYQTIRKRVNQYFEERNIEKTGNFQMYFKTLFMYFIYLTPFIIILTVPLPNYMVVLLYGIMGLGIVGIGLSVMHDALHGSYSKHKWVNNLVGYSMDIIGGSSFTWRIQHNILHHTFTNIHEIDEDITNRTLLRLSPYDKYKSYHRFQHRYAMFLYCLATVSWFFLMDFKRLYTYNSKGITRQYGFNPIKESIFLVSTKILYVLCMIGLPIMLGITPWAVVLGFFVMLLVNGLCNSTIFQLAHIAEGLDYFSPEPEGGKMDDIWAIHQLRTTANFANKSKVITWLVGGLNHQIEHHLFPSICHVHYSAISKIVRQTVAEYNLPYHDSGSFDKALVSHLRMLKKLGTVEFVQKV